MAPVGRPRWPTAPRSVFFDDVASRPTLSKAIKDGRIRRLAPKIYTADLSSSPEEIIAEQWSVVVGRFLPGAVIVDRSAATAGVITGEVLFVATRSDRNRIRLPGLEVRVRDSVALDTDLPWSNGLQMSSPARTLIDNLEISRGRKGRVPRTLSMAELEDWLAGKAIAWGPARLDRLHDEAVDLAWAMGVEDRIEAIDSVFAQLAGAEPPRRGAGRLFRAVTEGTAWDERRMEMFVRVATTLADSQPPDVPDWLPAPVPVGELPFYESYFSNYIEGTEFTLEEARTIIETQQPPADRLADGHDILGTYKCVVDPIGRAAASEDPDELIEHLVRRHQAILVGRPERRPGLWKQTPNSVGAYQFVAPDLVEGTLRKGFELVGRLPPGLARAMFVMVVVSEVHPFVDGNGRVARVMMNAELSATDSARIVIPNVYRNEYIAGLRRVSATNGDLTAFIKIMIHAWRWTAAIPWGSRTATEGQLEATNALWDSTDAQQSGIRLELP